MNANNYHIGKEKEVKALNSIGKLITENYFSPETKEVVKDKVITAINATLENRKMAYADEGVDNFEITYNFDDHVNDTLGKEQKNVSKDSVRFVAHTATELASWLKTQNAAPTAVIMNQHLKKYFPVAEFKTNEALVVKAIDRIISVINQEELVAEEAVEVKAKDEKKSVGTKIKEVITGSKKKKKN